MAYMKTTTYTSGVNILASEVGLVLKTFEGTQAMATQVDDKKIIKAGMKKGMLLAYQSVKHYMFITAIRFRYE